MEGGCLCGKVRYVSDAAPALIAVCHCADCQKVSGGGHSVNVAVPADALRIQGKPKAFEATGGSGQATTRLYCPDCGTHLVTNAAALAGLSLLKAGTLDDPSEVQPVIHIWCSSAQPWDQIPAGATCFPQMPPM
jgi:hypothetical protein